MDAILSQKITAQGKQIGTVQMQLESFKQGFPFLSLVAPAIPARGIQVWSESQVKDYQSYLPKNLFLSSIDLLFTRTWIRYFNSKVNP
jgi:hypothetical protein